MIAFIPSPSFNQIVLGPLHLRVYGLAIALGVVAAVWLAQRRMSAKGGNSDEIAALAMWAVPAGLIGARIYHVCTDWPRLYSNGRWWPAAFEVWHGGLGIPGGIAGGVIVGLWYARRHHLDIPMLLDVAAPALPLAQAIGRFGNYFNQELFGRPTTLPWGLRIDYANRVANIPDQRYWHYTTFQPTFLYEMLWNLGIVVLLLWVDRRFCLRSGKLFPAYIALYFLGRSWVEELRIDNAAHIFGLRWNFVLAMALVLVGAIWFLWGGIRRTSDAGPDSSTSDDELSVTPVA